MGTDRENVAVCGEFGPSGARRITTPWARNVLGQRVSRASQLRQKTRAHPCYPWPLRFDRLHSEFEQQSKTDYGKSIRLSHRESH